MATQDLLSLVVDDGKAEQCQTGSQSICSSSFDRNGGVDSVPWFTFLREAMQLVDN